MAFPGRATFHHWATLPIDGRQAGREADRHLLRFKYRCKVARDHTIRLDGSIVAFDGARELAVRAAPADPVQLRAEGRLRPDPGLVPGAATLPWTPPRDHPWKRVTPRSKLEKRLTESLNS